MDPIKYIPEHCLMEICFKCNLNCKHCGSSLNAYKNVRKGRLLTQKETIKIIDELKSLGGKSIGLVGGEPLLCDYWENIAIHSKDNGFKLSMISNGMLIDSNMAKKIKASGIDLVAISLDGDEVFHNYLRGNNNAYKNVLRAIKCLNDNHIQVNIITTIMKSNIDQLPYLENLLSKLDVAYWQLQLGIPMGKLKKHKDQVIVPNDLKVIEEFIVQSKDRKLVEITTADSIGYCSSQELTIRNNSSTNGNRFYKGCMAGICAVAIESNGNVKGCLSLQNDKFIEGNVLEHSLHDIWYNPNAFEYNRKFDIYKLDGTCKNCKYGLICRGGCTTLAYNTSGSIYNNPYCLYHLETNY